MRLVVLDTNVIVSAAIKPGSPPATLVMDWLLEGQIQVVPRFHTPNILVNICNLFPAEAVDVR